MKIKSRIWSGRLAVVEKMETLVKELLYVSKTDGKQRTEYKTIDFAELLRVQIADVTDLLSEKRNLPFRGYS